MQSGQTTSRILVVEDDADAVLLVKLLLKKTGVICEILYADDGAVALELLARHEDIRWVLMDLKLPKIDGYEVLAWIRAQPASRELPVVVMSSSSDPREPERAHALGATGFWLKFSPMDELADSLRRAVPAPPAE